MNTHKYYKIITVDYHDSDYFCLTNITSNTGHFKIKRSWYRTYWSYDIDYSLDGVNWTSYNMDLRPDIIIGPYCSIYLRGNNNQLGDSLYIKITPHLDVDYIVSGNLTTLLDKTNYSSITSLPANCFRGLFEGETNLTSAKGLNIGNVTELNYRSLGLLFKNCPSLKYGLDIKQITQMKPSLDPWNGDSLEQMYYNCYNLEEAYVPNVPIWDNGYTQIWMQNAGRDVTGTKTIYCPTGLTIPTDSNSGIPTGWTRVDY